MEEHPPRWWVMATPLAAACFLLAAILIAIAVFSERIEAELSPSTPALIRLGETRW